MSHRAARLLHLLATGTAPDLYQALCLQKNQKNLTNQKTKTKTKPHRQKPHKKQTKNTPPTLLQFFDTKTWSNELMGGKKNFKSPNKQTNKQNLSTGVGENIKHNV